MSVSHHLSAETLQDYAVGALTPCMETLIACHLTMCSHCRERLKTAENIGGALLEHSEHTLMRASSADILAQRDTYAPLAKQDVKRHKAQPGVPRPLGRLLPAPLDKLKWRRMAPGINQYNLSDAPRSKGAFKLLHLAAGLELSNHSHVDRELTYVVSGSYTDEIGTFATGDIADLNSSSSHRPVVDAGGPCIALIATQSPVRYSGVLSRLLQPFVGI